MGGLGFPEGWLPWRSAAGTPTEVFHPMLGSSSLLEQRWNVPEHRPSPGLAAVKWKEQKPWSGHVKAM